MIYLILLLSLIVRLINLNQSLWLDEAISVLAVKNNSYLSLLTQFAPGDFHPPLYYLVLKFWDGLFGYSEIASRVPSIIFGIATVYFVYLIGKKLFSERIGLIAAVFLALNPLAVYYSQEARMYSLAMMAVTAAAYFFLSKRWFWYFFFLVVAMYTDYLPWLMLPVFLFLARKNSKLLIAHCSLLIAFLPWAIVLYTQLQNILGVAGSSWGQLLGTADFKNLALFPVKFIFGRISLTDKVLYVLIAGAVVLFYGSVIGRARQRFLWAWLLSPLFLGIILSLKIPTLTYFRYLFVLPAFILLLAAGARKRWQQAAIIIISVISLIYFNLNPMFQREDWRGLSAYISTDPGLVLIPSLAQTAPLAYYASNIPVEDSNSFSPNGNTIYLLRYVQEIFDPADKLRYSLEQNNYQLTKITNFNGVIVWQYQKT